MCYFFPEKKNPTHNKYSNMAYNSQLIVVRNLTALVISWDAYRSMTHLIHIISLHQVREAWVWYFILDGITP